jgi:polysaccharide export outer membrane protein
MIRRFRSDESSVVMSPPMITTPAAVMLRPVPGTPVGDGTVVASAWQPAERVNEPGSATPGVTRVATTGTPDSPVISPPIASSDKTREGNAPDTPEMPLPTPRVMPQPALADLHHMPAGALAHPPSDTPREFSKRALSSYIVEPPDILLIQASKAAAFPGLEIAGPHLVRPDGTVGLGTYGGVFVAGLTIEQAKDAIARVLASAINKSPEKVKEELQVDVAAYNSKFYYVITDGGGYGEQVYRIPCTGNETVLDAIAQIQGLPAVSSKKRIWLARATPGDHGQPYILPIDWCGIAQQGYAVTNYQLFPGDRLYVHSDSRIRLDTHLQKILAPVERVLGVTLLGSSTVNSIKNRGVGSGTGTGR